MPLRTALVSLLLFACSWAPAFGAPAKCVSVPLHFTTTGIPLVRVTLGGVSRSVVFDLGSNSPLVLFDAAQARAYGARFTGTVRDAVNLKGETFERQVFRLHSLRLAGTELGPIKGSTGANWNAVFGKSGSGAVHDVVGVLGLTAFADRSVLLDYGHKMLRVCDRPQTVAKADRKDWHPFHFDKNDDVIVLPTTVDGRRVKLFIDTGATSSLVRTTVLTSLEDAHTRDCGRFDRTHACRLFSPDAISVGGVALHGVKFLVLDTPAPHDGILGANFLRRVRLLLDLGTGLGRIAFADDH